MKNILWISVGVVLLTLIVVVIHHVDWMGMLKRLHGA